MRVLQWVVACFAFAGPAQAQSAALLEAIRVHHVGLAPLAHDELEQCERTKPRPCPNRERLSLLTGVLLVTEGDAAGAVKQLSSVKAPKGLEAYHGWYLGEAQSWSTSRSAAVKTLQKTRAVAPAWLQKRIDLRSAELWLELGQAAKAKPILEAIDDPGPEVLFDRSLARKGTGDLAGAKADWQALYIRYPSHPHSVTAQALHEAAEKRPMALSFDNTMRRAQAQLNASATTAAIETLSHVPSPPGVASDALTKLQARVALMTGQALLIQGKDPEAFAAIEEAIAKGGPAVVAEGMMTKARRLMRVGDNAGAKTVFQSVDAKFPNEYSADEAGYFAAWLQLGLNDDPAAVSAFAAFEDHHPKSRRRDEARWFRGYVLFRSAQYARAREVLLSLISDFPRSSLVPQAKYWAIRSAGLAMQADDAGVKVDVAREYNELITGFGGTFYSLLAGERLRELGLAVPTPFAVVPKRVTPTQMPASLALAIDLAKTGLLRDANDEVQRVVAQVSADEALAYGQALQAIDEFGAAHVLAARYLWGAVYTLKQPEALALMYPQAYRPTVEQYAGEAGIDPALAWAIMRRESGFRPEVYSLADARGLMQIIPPTAKAIAVELKLPAPDADELYAPATNIQLGTWYLAALTKRLGHVALCAAAYNAGPSAVVRWVTQRGSLPVDQWIEEIPYKETRGYVKQVVADLFIYQQLYGGGKPVEPLSFTLPVPKATGVAF